MVTIPKLVFNEAETADWLADKLREHGFVVEREVQCRAHGGWGTGRFRLDLLVVPPAAWIAENGVRSIGIETKREGLGTGHGLVEPVLQAAAYSSAHAFQKDGVLLPRPEVIVIASPDVTKHYRDRSAFHADIVLLSRFAWKFGCAILERRFDTLGFESSLTTDMVWRALLPKGV